MIMLATFVTGLSQLALVIFYFFYFLLKGESECEKANATNCAFKSSKCCLHDSEKSTHSEMSTASCETKAESDTTNAARSSFGLPTSIFDGLHSIGQVAIDVISRLICIVRTVIYYLFYAIRSIISTTYSVVSQANMNEENEENIENFEKSEGEMPDINTSRLSDVNQSQWHKQQQQQQQQRGSHDELSEPSAIVDNGQLDQNEHHISERHRDKYEVSPEDEITHDVSAEQSSTIFHVRKPPVRVIRTESGTESATLGDVVGITSSEIQEMVTSYTNETKETKEVVADSCKSQEKVPPKGSVALFPPHIMSEASAKIKEREGRLKQQEDKDSTLNDWTVTSSQLIPNYTQPPLRPKQLLSPSNTANRNRSEYEIKTIGSTHTIRSSPYGIPVDGAPIPMAMTSTVVSQIPSARNEDSQFIFRAKTSNLNKIQSRIPEPNFLIGQSVYSPIREVEELRSTINKRASVTPTRTVKANDISSALPVASSSFTTFKRTALDKTYQSSRQQFDSSSNEQRSRSVQRTISPLARSVGQPSYNYHSNTKESANETETHLRHRSRTVEPFSEGNGCYLSRSWPSKTTNFEDQNSKELCAVRESAMGNLPTNVTRCRRIMERKVTDKWITRDEAGDVLDKWSKHSWQAESDGLNRKANGTGESWYTRVDVDPEGKTKFIDNRRFYTSDYVIESETRNT